MWLAIKLFFSGVLKVFLKYWKIIVPILIVIAAYFYINHLIDSARKEGYDNGYSIAEKQFNDMIEEEDRRNREFEGRLKTIIEEYGIKAVEEAAQRVSKETVYKETLRETIKNNPIYEQCVADQVAIDQRNGIRKLGPREVVSAPIKGLDE